MSMLGDLSEFPLPDILQMFDRSGKTGRLSIWASTGVHRIAFSQGRIIAAISPEPQYALNRILATSKLLGPEAMQQLKRRSELCEPLGKYFQKQGWVDASLLASAFRIQIQVGIYPLFHLERGQFRFSDKVPIPYDEMTGMSKSSIEVAMDGMRRCEAIMSVQDALPLPDSRFKRVSAELPLFKLSSLEWSVLENAASEYTVSELSQLLGCDLLEVRQVCGRLSKVSLLEESLVKPSQRKKASAQGAAEANLMADVMQKRLQGMAQKGAEEKADATSARPDKAAVNSNLLARFASMLKSL